MDYQDIFERHEIKYLLTEETYRELRARLDSFMAVDQYGETTILNIYYDTPNSRLIRRSLEKPVYKEKLRLRCYGVPGSESPAFLEIKKKYKGIVYKRRIAMPYKDAVGYMDCGKPVPEPSQISREIDYFRRFYKELQPKMVIACERIAMAGIQDPELRITFDRNIRWRDTGLDLRQGSEGRRIPGRRHGPDGSQGQKRAFPGYGKTVQRPEDLFRVLFQIRGSLPAEVYRGADEETPDGRASADIV